MCYHVYGYMTLKEWLHLLHWASYKYTEKLFRFVWYRNHADDNQVLVFCGFPLMAITDAFIGMEVQEWFEWFIHPALSEGYSDSCISAKTAPASLLCPLAPAVNASVGLIHDSFNSQVKIDDQ